LLNIKPYIKPYILREGEFNIPVSPIIGLPDKKKLKLNEKDRIVNKIDLIDFCRIFHQNKNQYTLFSELTNSSPKLAI
jgi:exonuclease III